MTQPDKPGWIGSASRQAALPGPLRELHRAVLRRFLVTGAPVVVSVRRGQWRWTPATAVAVFGSSRDCGPRASARPCPRRAAT